MKKKNKKMWKSFLINVLGVIVGISLTFGINAIWQKREENKKIKEMLILVRNELKGNKDILKRHEKAMKEDGYVYKRILEKKDDLTSIHPDTLKTYFSRLHGLFLIQLTTSAWQIFQNSEMIQKMPDKELVIRLTNCYNRLNTLCEYIMKEYWDAKKKMFVLEFDNPYRFFVELMKNNEYTFFLNMYSIENESVWEEFIIIDAMIDFNILLLDKHGDYLYDLDDKDNEILSFINARIDSVFHKKDTIHIKNENQ